MEETSGKGTEKTFSLGLRPKQQTPPIHRKHLGLSGVKSDAQNYPKFDINMKFQNFTFKINSLLISKDFFTLVLMIFSPMAAQSRHPIFPSLLYQLHLEHDKNYCDNDIDSRSIYNIQYNGSVNGSFFDANMACHG